MDLTYSGPQAAVRIPVPGGRPITVERGETADVPDEIGRDLVAAAPDNWTAAKAKPAKGSRKASSDNPADTVEEEK